MQEKEFNFKSQPPVYFGLSRANNHLPDGEEKVCPSLGMLLGPVSCVVRLGSEEEGRGCSLSSLHLSPVAPAWARLHHVTVSQRVAPRK